MAWKNIPEKKVLATLKDGKDFSGTASEKMTIYVEGGIPGSEGDVKGITVTVDPNTYVMTTQLKDGTGGNVGSPATVDLPLESMVVGGEYDEENKSIILTLKNGQTVEFSVADLVSGLQTEITVDNPLSADLIEETNLKQFVSGQEKEDIGTIAEISGTVSGLEDSVGNLTIGVSDLNDDVTTMRGDISGLTSAVEDLQGDMASKQDVIDDSNPLNADYIDDSGSEQKLLSSEEKDAISSLVVNDYTTYVRYVDTGDDNTAHYEDGNGSTIEFRKETIDGGAEPISLEVAFPDYNSFYIKRGMAYRITSSTMQNYSQITGLEDGIYSFDPEEGVTFYVDTTGEIELTKAGLLLVSNGLVDGDYCTTGTFFPTDGSPITRYVANQATDETKVEQIDGKMHIITSDDANDEGYVNIWRLGPGTYLVDPTLSCDVPLKVCNASMTGDMVTVTNAYGIWMVTGDSSYNAIYYFPAEDQSDLHTNFPVMYMVSEGEISARVPFASKTYVDNTVQNSVLKGAGAPTTSTAGQKGQLYEDTTNGRVYICTNRSGNTTTWKEIVKAGDNISVLNNNSGYQTASDVSSAIASAVGGITSFEYRVVQTLPQTGEAGVIYLVANSGTSPNIYDEYIWVNNAFEKIGTTEIDLSNYVTNSDLQSYTASTLFTSDNGIEITDENDNSIAINIDEDTTTGSSILAITGPDGSFNVPNADDVATALAGKVDAIDPTSLPSGAEQGGIIYVTDHTDIDPDSISDGQMVFDQDDHKLYIAEVTVDAETGENIVTWHEIETSKEVLYLPMTVTSVQNMTFTVSGYTAYDVCMLLDAGVNVIYRLTLTQSLPGIAAGIYDFRPILHSHNGNLGGVMASMVGPSGSNTICGIAYHDDGATSTFEMRQLANASDLSGKQDVIDANHKLSADLIDNSNSTNKTYETGTGAPTTSTAGSVGELYVDTTTGTVYVCTSDTGGTYTWETISIEEGSIKVLTSADYNWPTNSPTGIAIWALDEGIYSTGGATLPVFDTVTTSSANRQGVFVVYKGSTDTTALWFDSDHLWLTKNVTSTGSMIVNYQIPLTKTVVRDSLTSTSATDALSANQGRVLNNKIPVITMQTTDPGEGASLAANNFIAVYEV